MLKCMLSFCKVHESQGQGRMPTRLVKTGPPPSGGGELVARQSAGRHNTLGRPFSTRHCESRLEHIRQRLQGLVACVL